MKITEILAAGLRGSTPAGGWSNEIRPADCLHTLIRVRTDEGLSGWGSVFTVGLTIASIVYGPMLGAFLLGVLTTRATETGAMAGIGVSLVAMLAVYLWTPLAWTWYVLAGTIVCVTVGLSVSWVEPESALGRTKVPPYDRL